MTGAGASGGTAEGLVVEEDDERASRLATTVILERASIFLGLAVWLESKLGSWEGYQSRAGWWETWAVIPTTNFPEYAIYSKKDLVICS